MVRRGKVKSREYQKWTNLRSLTASGLWNSNPDHLFALRREQTLKGRQVCVCPHLLLKVSFLEWKWTIFLYTSGLLGINVSNLNNPGKGYIDRMTYDCHDAVIEINVNKLTYLVD